MKVSTKFREGNEETVIAHEPCLYSWSVYGTIFRLPRTRTSNEDRVVSVAGSNTWNKLVEDIRQSYKHMEQAGRRHKASYKHMEQAGRRHKGGYKHASFEVN